MTLPIAQELEEIARENSRFSPCPGKQYEYDRAFRDLQVLLAEWILSLGAGRAILDVGCAYGTLDVLLSRMGYSVRAIDNVDWYANPQWLAENGVDWLQQNIETVKPFPVEKYDGIIFSEVLEHLGYSPVPVVAKLYKALKPSGGWLIVSTPKKEFGTPPAQYEPRYTKVGHYSEVPRYEKYEESDAEHYYYSIEELRELFTEAGFQIEAETSSRGGSAHFLVLRK